MSKLTGYTILILLILFSSFLAALSQQWELAIFLLIPMGIYYLMAREESARIYTKKIIDRTRTRE